MVCAVVHKARTHLLVLHTHYSVQSPAINSDRLVKPRASPGIKSDLTSYPHHRSTSLA